MSIKLRLHFEMLIAACYGIYNPPIFLVKLISVQCRDALEYLLDSPATRFIDLTSDDESTAPRNASAPVILFVRLLHKSGRIRSVCKEIMQLRTHELSVHR